MSTKQENQEAMGFLEATYTGNWAKPILEFAKKNGLETAKICTIDQQEHPASVYAQHIYCHAENMVNQGANSVLSEALQVVTMLYVLEKAVMHSSWSYGSELMYKLRCAGINLHRDLICAFLAQEGTWENNRSKNALMAGNGSRLARYAAVGVFCGQLRAFCHSLTGMKHALHKGDNSKLNESLEERQETPQQTIEALARKYLPAYFEAVSGKRCEERLEQFLEFLRTSDFYTAPCSTKYHFAFPGGLAMHTVNVIYRLARLLLPATDAQLGEIVLAALGHDICKIGVYRKAHKSKKVYLSEDNPIAPEGAYVKKDGGGQFYFQDETYYQFDDPIPFGHGRKSMYIVLAYFGTSVSESVACAIDGHMGMNIEHPTACGQMMDQPLCLFLHLADMLAAHIDEADMEAQADAQA